MDILCCLINLSHSTDVNLLNLSTTVSHLSIWKTLFLLIRIFCIDLKYIHVSNILIASLNVFFLHNFILVLKFIKLYVIYWHTVGVFLFFSTELNENWSIPALKITSLVDRTKFDFSVSVVSNLRPWTTIILRD